MLGSHFPGSRDNLNPTGLTAQARGHLSGEDPNKDLGLRAVPEH